MNRLTQSRLRRIERMKAEPRVRYIISDIPYNPFDPDARKPTIEEIEASLREPEMTPEEWKAKYCPDEPR
ncbi:hypothetical protein SAMN05519104_1839 [Rhizobiales bacterium GAS188]|nr:hypothetical protein SAMN05519104_1839 [Rhizobiales bacterium GAS188]